MKSDSGDDHDDDDHPITLNSFAKATQSMMRSENKIDQRFIDLSRLNQAKRHDIVAGFNGFVADPYQVKYGADYELDDPNPYTLTQKKVQSKNTSRKPSLTNIKDVADVPFDDISISSGQISDNFKYERQ